MRTIRGSGRLPGPGRLLVAVTGLMRRGTVVALVAVVVAGLTVWWLTAPGDPRPDPGAREDVSEGPSSRRAGSATGTRDETVPDRAAHPAAEPRATIPAAAAVRTAEPSVPPPLPTAPEDGAACDDGDPCTFDDRRTDGTCRGRPLHCDDENPLTIDSCTGDGCAHTFVPGAFEPSAPARPEQPGR